MEIIVSAKETSSFVSPLRSLPNKIPHFAVEVGVVEECFSIRMFAAKVGETIICVICLIVEVVKI